MSKRLSAQSKFDAALTPQAINNTNVTGLWFHVSNFRFLLALLFVGAMAATKTAKLEFLQAKDASGTDSKSVDGAEATVTANTKVNEATLTIATAVAGNKVTINGVVFTAIANGGTPVKANHEWAVGSTDAESASALAAAINDPTYGIPGVIASAGSAVVTLKAANGEADTVITITDAAGTITAATTKASALVEFEVGHLDLDNGFEYVAIKFTTTANTVASATLVRGIPRFQPDQAVGAATLL